MRKSIAGSSVSLQDAFKANREANRELLQRRAGDGTGVPDDEWHTGRVRVRPRRVPRRERELLRCGCKTVATEHLTVWACVLASDRRRERAESQGQEGKCEAKHRTRVCGAGRVASKE